MKSTLIQRETLYEKSYEMKSENSPKIIYLLKHGQFTNFLPCQLHIFNEFQISCAVNSCNVCLRRLFELLSPLNYDDPTLVSVQRQQWWSKSCARWMGNVQSRAKVNAWIQWMADCIWYLIHRNGISCSICRLHFKIKSTAIVCV